MKTFIAAKIHGIHVTDKSVDYNGSVSIDRDLMDAAGIEPYEQVTIVNLNNGERWVTYALPISRELGKRPAFTLNGGGARLGEKGDPCIVLAYRQSERMEDAPVIFCDSSNCVYSTLLYKESDFTPTS